MSDKQSQNGKKSGLSTDLHQYLIDNSCRINPVLRELQEETFNNPISKDAYRMCSPFDSASLLNMLVKLTNAKKVVEIGVFTGFTTLAFALALPEDGKIYSLDISETYADVGKPFWEKAGVTSKIDLRIAPALDSMAVLEQEVGEEVDIVFIDADKTNYPNYYEAGMKLLRKGGIIVVDNVLWGGRVADGDYQDPNTVAIREINSIIMKDERVEVCMLPTADGVTIAYKI